MKLLPSVNASEYPAATQTTDSTEKVTNTCMSTESMFFWRTSPP